MQELVNVPDAILVLTGVNATALIGHALMAMRAAGRIEAKLEALEERVRRMEKNADARALRQGLGGE